MIDTDRTAVFNPMFDASDRSVLSLVTLPSPPKSISFRWYFAMIEGLSVFERSLQWARELLPNSRLVVTSHIESELSLIKSITDKFGAEIIEQDGLSPIEVLYRVSELLDYNSHILLLDPKCCLARPDICRALIRHHLKYNNSLTQTLRLPDCVYPAILSTEFISIIKQINLPQYDQNVVREPLVIFRHLLESKQFVKSIESELGSSLNSRPFDPAEHFDLLEADIPENVTIETACDIHLLRQVFVDAAEERGESSDKLAAWKKSYLASIRERLDVASAQARRSITRIAASQALANRKTRRALYVSVSAAYSGAEASLVLLMTGLDRSRYEPIAVLGNDGTMSESARAAGIRILIPEFRFWEPNAANISFFLNLLVEHEIGIVHLNGLCLSAVPAAKLCGVPVVIHMRVYPQPGMSQYLAEADRIIAVSRSVERSLLKCDLDPAKIVQIHNGVDTETFAPNNNLRAAAREKYDLTGNTILMIAGIHPRKRLDLLIKAAPRILGAIPDAQILFTGEVYDRMYYSTLRDLISRYGLETNIRFLGFQKHIQEIEAAADVLVMCSAEEPFARALLEALAMELPVVAVNTGGVAELITHMQTGVLVDNPNPDSLADRIVSALTDDDLRARLKIQGRLAVCNGFSIAAHTQSVMEIYDDLLEG